MTAAGTGHRIRLRGPWKFARAGGDSYPPDVRRHPDDWSTYIGSQAGRITLTRTFHAPSNLDDHETVFVVLTGVQGSGEVRLNGQPLGIFGETQSQWEFPVPRPLPFSNELAITVTFAAPTAAAPQVGLYDVVALEIRSVQMQDVAR